MSEISKLWLQKRFPDQYGAEARAEVDSIIQKTLKKHKLPPLDDKVAWKKQEAKAMEYLLAKEGQDTSFLDAFDLDMEEFLHLTDEAKHQQRAGKGRADFTLKYMNAAVDAFIKAESLGLNFKQSWQLARSEINDQFGKGAPHESTLRAWLKEIAGRPWCAIPKSSGQGRPRSNPSK